MARKENYLFYFFKCIILRLEQLVLRQRIIVTHHAAYDTTASFVYVTAYIIYLASVYEHRIARLHLISWYCAID